MVERRSPKPFVEGSSPSYPLDFTTGFPFGVSRFPCKERLRGSQIDGQQGPQQEERPQGTAERARVEAAQVTSAPEAWASLAKVAKTEKKPEKKSDRRSPASSVAFSTISARSAPR